MHVLDYAHMPLILIVDDNDEHRSMYTTFLRLAGFRVIGAPDGFTGISRAHAMRPDVILMDLYMPGLDGWQACRQLKNDVETARIPVIALTGLGFDEAKVEAMEAGCARFVGKGGDLDGVIRTIREVLASAA
jgi:CheY-like chemotaxis protein